MISVIIPVYNAEQYLDKCLQSVLSNSYKDLEVICVNDGSTDSSPDILQKWQSTDPRIVTVSQENLGLPEARNRGLEIASGDYTFFIDADDWVHPQCFQCMLECMEKTEADLVMCKVQKVEVDGAVEAEPISDLQYRRLTAKEYYEDYYGRLMIWGKLLRRRDTERLRFPSEVDSYQDTLYNLRLVAHLEQPNIYIIEAPLYYYLNRPGSLSKKRTYKEQFEIANWYVKHERGPLRQGSSAWDSLLLLHAIHVGLQCRYKAHLLGDRAFVKHSNVLLRILLADLIRDETITLKKKTVRAAMILIPGMVRFLPWLSRMFKKMKGSTKRV